MVDIANNTGSSYNFGTAPLLCVCVSEAAHQSLFFLVFSIHAYQALWTADFVSTEPAWGATTSSRATSRSARHQVLQDTRCSRSAR